MPLLIAPERSSSSSSTTSLPPPTTSAAPMNSLTKKVLTFLSEQANRPEVQQIWRTEIVQPCLASMMDVLLKEYVHQILLIVVIWALLVGVVVALFLYAVRTSLST